MAEEEIAIRVSNLEKVYKLYNKPSDRLREAFSITGKKRHTDHHALQDVNLTIHQGEAVGIIGTNGSGKSTLLKIMTGVVTPTSGTVEVHGRVSALLELGAGFNMEYNGIENIYLNGTMIGFSEAEIKAKMDDILAFADIGPYVYQPVKTYSSGMFVRLAFAVAINIDPEILIVDEALSVGDVFFQAKCYHKFEEFKAMGKTIVFVSHDLSSVSKYCDRVVLLHNGVKLGEGAPKPMIDAYKQVLVGQYPLPDDDRSMASGDASGQATDSQVRADSPAGQAPDGQTDAAGTSNAQGVSVNPDLLEYGSRKALITEYYLTDERGNRTAAILKDSVFQIHMKVKILENLPAPIFAFTIKNAQGTEITGTNTALEKAFLEPATAGQTLEIVFSQRMNLQGGDYLLSLGLTGYEGDDFTVYHRLYDVLSMTVVSDKDTVGFYDMGSEVQVRKSEE